ncbi:MobA/MobL family protein, partial [Endozoicomonas sp. SM1973]
MAIYHCKVKVISRSTGRSSTGAAAYRAGERIVDERTGIVHDYRRKSGVSYSQILAPRQSPSWSYDRAQLWNEVEKIEKRKDSQLCREVEVALPRELNEDEMRILARDYAQEQFVDRGMIADISIHHAKDENPHAHILLTTRDVTPEGFGKKNRDWNQKELLENWREAW